MKKGIIFVAAVVLCLVAFFAITQLVPGMFGDTQPPTDGPTTVGPSTTVLPTTTVPGTTAPVLTGWQDIDGSRYYYDVSGKPMTGWQTIDGSCYYLGESGAMHTGWLEQDAKKFYLGTDGVLLTGWQEVDGLRRYFLKDGSLGAGFVQIEQQLYYLNAEGTAGSGWLDVGEKRYYLTETGVVYTGWLELDAERYYFKADGAMARGCVEIEGVKNYFTSTGTDIILANPWNFLPEDYSPNLVSLKKYDYHGNQKIDSSCHEALMQMLQACEKEVGRAVVVSAYRTHEFQTKNYQRKVTYYLNQGYSQAEAEVLAAKVVAVPGTSEHQVGLAVDIVDAKWPYLEEEQESKPAQKWLMEHCWEYGFILRYPKGTTEVTGIIYEPWHYRYVGKDVAAEIHAAGVTLEEYLDALTEQ